MHAVAPELAPLAGDCSVCGLLVDRSSFCCGCGHFVCWTHGEPPALCSKSGSQRPFTPHALADHTCGEATRAA